MSIVRVNKTNNCTVKRLSNEKGSLIMKYSIEGFNQRAALGIKKEIIKNGKKNILKLDITDLVILRWFVDFFPKMKKYTEADKQYAWVHYESILEDIPLLQIGKTPLYRRLQKMVSLGILTHKHLKVNGSFSYYGFGENYNLLNIPKKERKQH